MTRIVLLVGTRKGCFLLESDADAPRLGACAGRSARAGRSTTRCTTPDSGAIYAAAASEWHGAAVWRARDLGETWELSSEGLGYGEHAELKLSKVSGLAAAHGRVLAGAEAAGVFESRDGGATWSLLSTLDDQPGRDEWNVPTNQPPGPSRPAGASSPHPDDPAHFWVVVQGFGIFETDGRRRHVDAAQPGPARRRGRVEDAEVGFCVHKLVMSPADRDRLYQQNHCGMHRSDDAGPLLDGDHRGAADRLRLRRRRPPARPRHAST